MTTSKLVPTSQIADVELAFTGERVIPGKTPLNIFLETQARYVFAGRFVKGQRVLDVASGTGIGTHYLTTAGAKACVGLDADLAAVEYANRFYGNDQCRFAISDATELCLSTGSMDVIVSFETIEHLPDPSAFLRECARVLRPEGHFICSTPDREFFRWMAANPFHVSEMTRGEFISAMREVFPQYSLYGQGSVNYPLYIAEMLARKYLSPRIDGSRLKSMLKRWIVKPSGGVAGNLEFSNVDVSNEQHKIVPYFRGWLHRFPYFLVTATKGLSSNLEFTKARFR